MFAIFPVQMKIYDLVQWEVFPANQAVNWEVSTWVNFNVKHTGVITQGFITWYQLLIQKHSQNRNLTWQVCQSINCFLNNTAST